MADTVVNTIENLGPSKRSRIQAQLKMELVNSVLANHLSIHQASKIHKINYSSAKYIIHKERFKLRSNSKNLSLQKKKFKPLRQTQMILVDTSTGSIYEKLFRHSGHMQDEEQELENYLSSIPQSCANMIVENVRQKIKSEFVNEEQFPQNNIISIEQLRELLSQQHVQMSDILTQK